MAFSAAERDVFALHGLLPPHVASLDEQVNRRLDAFHNAKDDLGISTQIRRRGSSRSI